MPYHHTQTSPGGFRFGVIVFLIVIALFTAALGDWIGLVITATVGLIVVAAMGVFGRFTTEVTGEGLEARFGWGWPRRTLRWEQATAVRIVRNRWWYGLGIRWFPGGTLWNVWGLDGVEFDLVKGRKLRIGTDEPEQLLAALAGKVAVN